MSGAYEQNLLLQEMEDDPQSTSKPEFPALIVHDDSSIGGLPLAEYWTDDVDQWFWSSSSDYLVDVLGRKFEQRGERDNSGRPLSKPTWVFVHFLSADEVQRLVQTDFPSARGSVREIVERINVLENE